MINSTFVLRADEFTFDAAEDVIGVYFTSQAQDTAHYVLISRYDDPDDADGFHIERDDQAFGCYGAASEATLSPTSLSIVTTPDGAACLGYASLEVHLKATAEQLSRLRDTLTAVFANTDCRFTYKGPTA